MWKQIHILFRNQVHFQANTAWKYLNLLLESKCLLLEDLKNSQEEKVYLKMQSEAGRKPVDYRRSFWLQKNNSWAVFFLVVISLHIPIPSSFLSSHLHRNRCIILLSKKCNRFQNIFEIPQTSELPFKWDRIPQFDAISNKFYTSSQGLPRITSNFFFMVVSVSFIVEQWLIKYTICHISNKALSLQCFIRLASFVVEALEPLCCGVSFAPKGCKAQCYINPRCLGSFYTASAFLNGSIFLSVFLTPVSWVNILVLSFWICILFSGNEGLSCEDQNGVGNNIDEMKKSQVIVLKFISLISFQYIGVYLCEYIWDTIQEEKVNLFRKATLL